MDDNDNNKHKAKKALEKVAEAPMVALEKAIETTEKLEQIVIHEKPVKKAKAYWKTLGPGLTTGAADDDCSGIATYSQTGTRYGFQLLWLAGFTFPLMAIVQEMCARIGMVTGRGLAANIRLNFPRWVLYITTILLFIANTFNIGADIGAIAEAMRLLAPGVKFGIFAGGFTLLILGLEIFTSYKKYAKYLKYLALVLLAYVATAFLSNLNWGEVAYGALIPKVDFSKEQIILICGILGTTISPYLFFWQTSQEVEEEILDGKKTITERQNEMEDKDIKKMRIDVWSGMFFSNLVMFFIIATCAQVLNKNGIININTAADAAEALTPFAGGAARLFFTIGIVGVGLLAIPILAGSASYAMSECFGWKEGLYHKLKEATAFYGVIIIAMLIGLLLNFVGLDPIKALIYAAVANGLVAPVVLILIVILSSKKILMGKWANGSPAKIFGWLCVIIMIVASVATIAALLG